MTRTAGSAIRIRVGALTEQSRDSLVESTEGQRPHRRAHQTVPALHASTPKTHQPLTRASVRASAHGCRSTGEWARRRRSRPAPGAEGEGTRLHSGPLGALQHVMRSIYFD